jgi:hypothetical protein
MSTDVGIWLSALITIGLYSYLYKENPYFRVCEHMYLGLSLAHLAVMGFNNIKGVGFGALAEGQYLVLFPMVLGLLLFTRWSPKVSWLSRYSLAYLVGVAAGITITGVLEAGVIAQIRGAIQPLDGIESVLMLIFDVAAISVFFYILGSVSDQGRYVGGNTVGRVIEKASVLGRFVLMISFGAVFGTTVMARLGLFIPRLELLFRDWIHLIK